MLQWIQQLLQRPKPFQAVIEDIPHAQGRRLVIPDIHGCIHSFEALLEKVKLAKKDQLFLLGDYISKGPYSRKVLDKILELRSRGFYVYALRGNHEQLLIDCLEERPYELSWLAEKLGFTDLLVQKSPLTRQKSIKTKHKHFLNSLPYAFVLKDYILVHAGLDFERPRTLDNLHSMLWTRSFNYRAEKVGGRRIVHGHTPLPFKTIEQAIKQKSAVIKLDNGCVYLGEREGQGNLLCLNLDSWELWTQERLD